MLYVLSDDSLTNNATILFINEKKNGWPALNTRKWECLSIWWLKIILKFVGLESFGIYYFGMLQYQIRLQVTLKNTYEYLKDWQLMVNWICSKHLMRVYRNKRVILNLNAECVVIAIPKLYFKDGKLHYILSIGIWYNSTI